MRTPLLITCCVLLWLAAASADDAAHGRLIIIGGGLRPDNLPIHDRLVETAGGPDRARFGILPTASDSAASAGQVAQRLIRNGIPADRVHVLDLTVANAERQASNPTLVEEVRRCTGIFFTGGDQRRIMRALLHPDGRETPVLAALREMWRRGGVVAGTSAGAAVQSDPMICVSGLPDESLDEGMDALDFGVRRDPRHRGVMVARGLGFFRGGVIDQHFGQYRGRLGRLARVLIEERVRYGFGIDENTALAVELDGSFEVLGHGSVTIVDASMARCADGPLGCRITGLRLSCLHEGDRFDPRTGAAVIHPGRDPIVPGQESYNGNFLVPDIAGEGAVWSALFAGLVDNASHEQVGITLKHAEPHAHGYRFTFREADGTQGYAGYVNGVYSYAVLGVALEIEPVAGPLQRPEELLPADLRDGPLGTAGKALWFRGVLLADSEGRFRPHQPITRAELAGALARAVHLEPPRSNPPEIADVAMSSPLAGDVVKVVSAGWMPLDASGAFAPDGTLTREQAAAVLVRAAHTDLPSLEQAVRTVAVDDAADITPDLRAAAVAALEAGLLTAGETRFRPADALTRGEAAQALGRIIGFTWSRDAD